MTSGFRTAALAAAILTAFAGAAVAQNPSNGTAGGANTNSPMAGTGNAGDRTAEPGSTPSSAATKHVKRHKMHKSKSASSPAMAASQ